MRKLIITALLSALAIPSMAVAQNRDYGSRYEPRYDQRADRDEDRRYGDADRYGDRRDWRDAHRRYRDDARDWRDHRDWRERRYYGRNDRSNWHQGNRRYGQAHGWGEHRHCDHRD
jgi:hypothetical protein